MRLTKRKKVKNYYKNNKSRKKIIKNKSRKNDKRIINKTSRKIDKRTIHHYGGGFFTKKVKQLAKPLREEPPDFSNRELAKTYLDRALPIYREENKKFKHVKGMRYYIDPLNMTDEDIQLALQKDNHMAMNLYKEYLLYFLKMCAKHNFRPIYTAWYRTFEHEKINTNYEITDNRTWRNIEGGFLNLWITMTGDEKPVMLYIFEDLEIVAKYYFMKNKTKGHKLFKYLRTIFDKYSSNTRIGKHTSNIYDNIIKEYKEYNISQGVEIENIDEFIHMRLQNIANSEDLTKVKVASYLRKFNNVKVETINKIHDNVTELQDEHGVFYNLRNIKKAKDTQTSSFINREKDFMDVLKKEKLNPSDYISPIEQLESIDLYRSRKIQDINTDQLPQIDPRRQTLHDLPSFLQEQEESSKSKSKSKSRSRSRTQSRLRSMSNTL